MKQNTTSKKYSLLIAHLLMENGLKKEEIQSIFNIKDGAFYKNLQNIKHAGFYLDKKDEKYAIEYFKNSLKLNDNETSLLAYILTIGTVILPKYKVDILKQVIKKVLLLSDKSTYEDTIKKFDFYKLTNYNKFYKEKIETIDKNIKEEKTVIITTKSKKEYLLKPLNFIIIQDKIYVNFINENKRIHKKIAIDNIVKITPRNKKNHTPQAKETIFRLYGKLTNSYLLKEEERIVDTTKDSLTIANSSSEKKELFKRLLRYENLCKILYPKTDSSDFKDMLNQSILNLK